MNLGLVAAGIPQGLSRLEGLTPATARGWNFSSRDYLPLQRVQEQAFCTSSHSIKGDTRCCIVSWFKTTV